MFDTLTGELKQVSNGYSPEWSPDGKRIAFIKEGDLWIADLDTGDTEKYVEGDQAKLGQEVVEMAWSPDGKSIAYLVAQSMGRYPEVRVIDFQNRSDPYLLLSGTIYSITGLEWSPDSQELLYRSSEGKGSGPDGIDNLWTISIADKEKEQLTRDMTVASWDWSPDGKWLSINATIHYERTSFLYDGWLMDATGSLIIRLSSASPEEHGAHWSPDGTRLILLREGVGLVTFSLETGKVTPIGIDPGYNFAIGSMK